MTIVFSEALTAHYDEVKEETQFARILEERSWDNKIVAYTIFSDIIGEDNHAVGIWDCYPNPSHTIWRSKFVRIEITKWRSQSDALEIAKIFCNYLANPDYGDSELAWL